VSNLKFKSRASIAKKTVSTGIQTETDPEIQPSDLEPIKATNHTTRSDKHNPSTFRHFGTILPCDKRTDGLTTAAYTMLT